MNKIKNTWFVEKLNCFVDPGLSLCVLGIFEMRVTRVKEISRVLQRNGTLSKELMILHKS